MPNGNRSPYRIVPSYEPPSPAHTSDSEDTYVNKARYTVLASWVYVRWKALVAKRAKARRVSRFLAMMRLFPLLTHRPTILNIISDFV